MRVIKQSIIEEQMIDCDNCFAVIGYMPWDIIQEEIDECQQIKCPVCGSEIYI